MVFPKTEYLARVHAAQQAMAQHGFGALWISTEAEFRYFTGYMTKFWESPCRPWYLVIPASGLPIAVIPGIGAALMAKTIVQDIRTWAAPDPVDDGVSLLADCLAEVANGAPIAVPSGQQSLIRMPLNDLTALQQKIAPLRLVDDAGIVRSLRMVKSTAEIEKIRTICGVAGRAFDRVGEIAAPGVSLRRVFGGFQSLCLQEGADWVPYLAGGAGAGGYDDVISPADDTPLAAGDVLMLDTGAMRDGYFCDYDRNFAIGHASDQVKDGYKLLIEATAAGADALHERVRACDVFAAMHRVLARMGDESGVGRMGHGLGLQLTEWPSLNALDETPLRAGMVMTLEPSLTLPGGGVLVHEDNYAITTSGADKLSPDAAPELPIIG